MARPLSNPRPLRIDGSDFPETLREDALRLMQDPAPARALTKLLLRAGKDVTLLERARAAVALRAAAPTDRMIWAATDDLVYTQVPTWHWPMLEDLDRAQAYQVAISAAVGPGMQVLEIGAGTGLLAMMAAKAGAEHVYTVEANPLMADVARACVARNGLSDQITVINGHSSQLEIGVHLPRRADTLIHEIFSSSVVTEGLVPSLVHAKAELLAPGATLLPEAVDIMTALSEDLDDAEAQWWWVGGFDLSPLAVIDAAAHGVPGTRKRRRLSAPVLATTVDLHNPALNHERFHHLTLHADTSGVVAGVSQWMNIRFPCGKTLCSDTPRSHWGACFHPLAAHKTVSPGDAVRIDVGLGAARLAIGLSPDALDDGWERGL